MCLGAGQSFSPSLEGRLFDALGDRDRYNWDDVLHVLKLRAGLEAFTWLGLVLSGVLHAMVRWHYSMELRKRLFAATFRCAPFCQCAHSTLDNGASLGDALRTAQEDPKRLGALHVVARSAAWDTSRKRGHDQAAVSDPIRG